MRVFPGWWQVAVALILQAASSASVFTAYSVIAMPLQETFEPSRMVLMMGITMAALAAGTLGPPIGAAIDRFSIRLLMLAGAISLSGGFVLLSFISSMTQALLVYLLPLALGSVLTGPLAGSALLARWFTRRRGLTIGIAASGAAIGGLLVPPALQFLIDTFEWRMALRIYGVSIFLITVPLTGLLVIDRPADRNLYPDGDSEPSSSPGHDAYAKAGSMLPFLRDRNFWFIAFSLGMLLAGPMALISNLMPLVLEKNIGATYGAILLSIFSGANFVGKLTSGAIADKLDYRIMLAAILALICIGMLGYVQFGTYAMLVVFSLLLGISQGATVPLWSIILARVYGPENMGRSMGLMILIIMPFTLVAPPLFGWVYDFSGSYDHALLGYIALLLCTLALIAMIRHPQPVTASAAA